jgi:hypothetical protein
MDPLSLTLFRILKQPLSLKAIVPKLSNVIVSIAEIPLSIILKPILSIETPFNIFYLQLRVKFIVFFIVVMINISDRKLITLFGYSNSIAVVEIELKGILMLRVHYSS